MKAKIKAQAYYMLIFQAFNPTNTDMEELNYGHCGFAVEESETMQ